MTVIRDFIKHKKDLKVIRLSGTREIGEPKPTFTVEFPRKDNLVYAFNSGPKSIQTQTAPTLNGPWMDFILLPKGAMTTVYDVPLHYRLDIQEGDAVEIHFVRII